MLKPRTRKFAAILIVMLAFVTLSGFTGAFLLQADAQAQKKAVMLTDIEWSQTKDLLLPEVEARYNVPLDVREFLPEHICYACDECYEENFAGHRRAAKAQLYAGLGAAAVEEFDEYWIFTDTLKPYNFKALFDFLYLRGKEVFVVYDLTDFGPGPIQEEIYQLAAEFPYLNVFAPDMSDVGTRIWNVAGPLVVFGASNQFDAHDQYAHHERYGLGDTYFYSANIYNNTEYMRVYNEIEELYLSGFFDDKTLMSFNPYISQMLNDICRPWFRPQDWLILKTMYGQPFGSALCFQYEYNLYSTHFSMNYDYAISRDNIGEPLFFLLHPFVEAY